MNMLLLWTGICSLVLAGAWTYFTLAVPSVHLLAWAGFTGWASHFAAGGGPTGLKKALASTVSGGIWALIALNVYSAVGAQSALLVGVLVGIIAFFMVLQAHADLLSFIPGAFLGAGTWFGATVSAGRDGAGITGVTLGVLASMVIGAFLGYVNEAGGKTLSGAK
ncbi:MAG TPA: DUF1097 domain-containing protein [Candidatus Methylomirabilis sp.]|nr:DUF1097 domain-containing protein [Candidatus Methylomirabilis sp.]